MSHTTCAACRRGNRPCDQHAAANTDSAIAAVVARDSRPYNAPGGRGTGDIERADAGHHEFYPRRHRRAA